MLRRALLCLALFATGEAAKAKADPKECEVCIANLEAIDKLIDKDEKTSKQSIMEAITKQNLCGNQTVSQVRGWFLFRFRGRSETLSRGTGIAKPSSRRRVDGVRGKL